MASSEPASKKQKTAPTLNCNLALDKPHEGKTFAEILDLPPSALQGLGETADAMLCALKVTTIRQLGEWRFYKWARAIVTLAETEEEGKRAVDSKMEIDDIVVKDYEHKTFKEIAQAPPHALQGLAEWADTHLKPARITTVADLANWKYARWAESMITLADREIRK
eukprot:TRINITY_DN23899_c0_g1_i1.p1 TRINITY_DN23899_c0_g1~~TRINITY_DN23899_c0_g1_i1.p1  ORF type:complete len:166 (+),score=26.85 TRINITY_DN23899_c0_g1_i1:64-561(+)